MTRVAHRWPCWARWLWLMVSGWSTRVADGVCGGMQGKTVEVGRAHFETLKTRFTILDAPVRMSTHLSMMGCNVNSAVWGWPAGDVVKRVGVGQRGNGVV